MIPGARPELNRTLDGSSFLQWYWLKEELVIFCRENGIPASGSKVELTARIADFLDTGYISGNSTKNRRRPADTPAELSLDNVIEDNFVCSEKHRAFFKEQIGNSFSFNVAFQKWLKSNAGFKQIRTVRPQHPPSVIL